MLLIIVAGLLCTCLSSGLSTEASDRETIRAIQNEQQKLRDLVELLVVQVTSTTSQHETAITKLTENNHDLRDRVSMLTDKIKILEETRSKSSSLATVYNQNQVYGCLAEELTLSCPSGHFINVTRAYYGMSPLNCTDTCCPPQPSDCKELVSENSPVEWGMLLSHCNDQQSCSHDYMGAVIDECWEHYIADYMEIFYDCLLYHDYAPVGFSAYASSTRQYNYADLVLFDVIISNIGNHYNPDTSSFTCPYNGLYFFSVNFNADGSHQMLADIVRDDVSLIRAWAHINDNSQAAGFVVTECNIGEVVCVRCGSSSDYMYGSSDRRSHFSGALLYAYV